MIEVLEKRLGRALSADETAAAESALERARLAHPRLVLDPVAFFSQLQVTEDLQSELNGVHAGDLLLACRCAAGDRAAIEWFDQRHLARVPAVVRRLDGSGRLGDEVTQALREKLLLPRPGGKPRIADFTGRGGLDAWLRAAAVRTALNLRRSKTELLGLEPDTELADHVDLRPDPELDLARATSKKAFSETFVEALAGLPSRDRAVLKLHYIDGLTTQKIAVIYGTHRVTITRWLVSSRQVLLDQIRNGLQKRLDLDTLELDSLLRLAKASFDVSLGRHLGKE